MKYQVIPIKKRECKPWLLDKHYARRMPSISYAFGLFDSTLQGVCTFGTPASSTLLKGVCGSAYASIVQELNRLVINTGMDNNAGSYFMSKCFKLLPSPSILISYADSAQGHHGYIYQATNWIYTGLSSKFLDPKVKGLEHQHHATFGHGLSNQQLRAKFGDKLYFVERSRKHRYVYFIGSKKERRTMTEALRYAPQPYPKGDNKRYDAPDVIETQGVMFL